MANLNLSQFGEKLFVADADHTFIWDTANAISKRVSRNSWLSGTTADFHLGLADAATAVAQTISVQSVVAGTTNTAGANLSINGSQGTGTGAGGSLLLRTAPAGSSGTAQNALVTAVAITSAGNVGIGTTAPGAKLHIQNAAGLTTLGSSSALIISGREGGSGVGERQEINFKSWNGLPGTTAGLGIVTTSTASFELADLYFALKATAASTSPTEVMRITSAGNVGIGTTSPSSKLHVAGSSSPSITVDNTLATGASQLLFKNTVVTGDTDGIFLNGSAQAGFGGNGSLNIKATTGPIAFHTASVTNALSIAQSGAAIFSSSVVASSFYPAGVLGLSHNGLAVTLGTNAWKLQVEGLLLCFSGNNASFPAFKRVGAEFQVVNAGTTAALNVAAPEADLTFIEDRYRRKGAGTPEGVVTAPIGAVYHNTTGGAGTSFYVKESGTGNTGWVGK